MRSVRYVVPVDHASSLPSRVKSSRTFLLTLTFQANTSDFEGYHSMPMRPLRLERSWFPSRT